MAPAAYRFLPWARRGLSAMIPAPDTGQDLPQRPALKAGLTVSNVGSHGVDLSLYGPADVIGIDPHAIIRVDPRPHATDCEPNYLAAIEFDLPEMPWLFSPAAANAQERLRPWLVLVVLETSGDQAVALPRVEAGRPLPFIELTARQVAEQLPDLAQSWAWAHGQLLTEKGAGGSNAAALAGDYRLNLSRILCPRRLQPMTSYVACLVPAFDLGVIRGLGGTPAAGALLKPAWKPDSPADLVLPVYFHWTFATGAEGDFESLARELKPFKCPPGIGTTPMFIWDSLPKLMDATAPDVQAKPVLMDGALRASEGVPARLAEIDAGFTTAITAEINAPADIADLSAPDATRTIAAPIYGGFHARAVRVTDTSPGWLRDVNLDPRARAAAGLAADVVRTHQEVFMQSCWEQVGKVLEANALLNQSRLATEALARLHTRIKTLPAARQLALTAPVGTRVTLGSLTITAGVNRSSLPDATQSAPFRRLLSTRRPALRAAARALAVSPAVGLVERLAPGSQSVDPNSFTPDGIDGLRQLDKLTTGVRPGDTVDLSSIGIPATVRGVELLQLAGNARRIGAAQPSLELRANIANVGLVTEAQLATFGRSLKGTPVTVALDGLLAKVEASPRAAAFLVEPGAEGGASITALDVTANGQVLARTPAGAPDRVLARFGPGFGTRGTRDFVDAVVALPVGMLGSGAPLTITRDAGGRVFGGDFSFIRRAGRFTPRPPAGTGFPVADLVRDAQVIDRYARAFAKSVDVLAINQVDPALRLVPFDLAAAAAATASRIDPRRTVPGRLASMIQIGGVDAFDSNGAAASVLATLDRVMCAPELPEPAYRRLAELDKSAFLPGIDDIPHNTLTLLETNPRFIEAYMIGLNHEMNRELLWRSYPTDQRGTPFRHFWDWDDGQPDIEAIHRFNARALGLHTRGGADGGNLVLLVRGSLLRRYPNSTIAAWKAVDDNGRKKLKPNPAAGDYVPAAFFGSFDPDVSFAGFPLTREDIVDGSGWFFVIEQQVTEPRFGFDEAPRGAVAANPANWRDARWIDTGTPARGHLSVTGRLAGHAANGVTLTRNAADFAAATMQRPFRLAVHASYLTQF